jgi:hypothetical protein
MMVEVYNRLLSDLAANPDALLGDPIVPLQTRGYHFSLTEPGDSPRRHDFLFGVDRDDADRVLHVVGARHTTDDTNGEIDEDA